MNWKYKMPESKHFASLSKFFTDFQKVSFDQKDFPITLLDQIYTLNIYDSSFNKANDKKHRI